MMSTPIKSTHDPNESETEETHGQAEEPSRKRRRLVESTISASTQSRYILYHTFAYSVFFSYN